MPAQTFYTLCYPSQTLLLQIISHSNVGGRGKEKERKENQEHSGLAPDRADLLGRIAGPLLVRIVECPVWREMLPGDSIPFCYLCLSSVYLLLSAPQKMDLGWRV